MLFTPGCHRDISCIKLPEHRCLKRNFHNLVCIDPIPLILRMPLKPDFCDGKPFKCAHSKSASFVNRDARACGAVPALEVAAQWNAKGPSTGFTKVPQRVHRAQSVTQGPQTANFSRGVSGESLAEFERPIEDLQQRHEWPLAGLRGQRLARRRECRASSTHLGAETMKRLKMTISAKISPPVSWLDLPHTNLLN